MARIESLPLKQRLRRLGIRHYDVLIHDQAKEWLIEAFSHGATTYPINVVRLMRNIIWQTRERIRSGEKSPLNELIRTFWYMYIKPTLSRAGALSQHSDQYSYLSGTIADMVMQYRLMRYADIGFRDENQAHRRIGANLNIILFSEKIGHYDFLSTIADKYNISIIALGSQPSLLNIEYFVDSMKETGFNLNRSFYLFSIVDYDTSGWILRDAFVKDLNFFGIHNIHMVDLINPDMLTPEEIALSRYLIKSPASMRYKNQKWLKEVYKRNYRNQQYLEEPRGGKQVLYGLEAESVSSSRLEEKLRKVMVPLIGKSEILLKVYELRKLDRAVKSLILHKLTTV